MNEQQAADALRQVVTAPTPAFNIRAEIVDVRPKIIDSAEVARIRNAAANYPLHGLQGPELVALADSHSALLALAAEMLRGIEAGTLRHSGTPVVVPAFRKDTVERWRAQLFGPVVVAEPIGDGDKPIAPRCSVCGKVAVDRDIDGAWWPPCEHARTVGIQTLRFD